MCEAIDMNVHLSICSRVGGSVSLNMAAGAVGPMKREAQLLGEGLRGISVSVSLPPSKHTHIHRHTRAYILYIPTHTHSLYHSHRKQHRGNR